MNLSEMQELVGRIDERLRQQANALDELSELIVEQLEHGPRELAHYVFEQAIESARIEANNAVRLYNALASLDEGEVKSA